MLPISAAPGADQPRACGRSGVLSEPGGTRLVRAHLSRVVEPGDCALADEVAEHGWAGVARRLDTGEGPQRWLARHRALTATTGGLVEAAARQGIAVVVPGDEAWPDGLDDLGPAGLGPVACLWVRGRLPGAEGGVAPASFGDRVSQPGAVLEVPAAGGHGRVVAMVGARACSAYGDHVATEAAAGLVAAGWTVVSGAAYGIDAAAHRGALAAAGLHATVPTVAVLACGVDRAYPAGHADLLSRIVAAGGAVVSELPPGARPQRWRFLQRNRVIAAMSTATVVIEAAARSGAAGTARAAAALSRAVAAVPGPVTAATSAGCHGLIRDGVATLVRGSADIIELASPLGFGLDVDPSVAAGIETAGAGALTERVLACLSRSHGLATAHVAVLAGLDVADVRGILLDLENDGRVECRDGGWAPSPARPPASRRRP